MLFPLTHLTDRLCDPSAIRRQSQGSDHSVRLPTTYSLFLPLGGPSWAKPLVGGGGCCCAGRMSEHQGQGSGGQGSAWEDQHCSPPRGEKTAGSMRLAAALAHGAPGANRELQPPRTRSLVCQVCRARRPKVIEQRKGATAGSFSRGPDPALSSQTSSSGAEEAVQPSSPRGGAALTFLPRVLERVLTVATSNEKEGTRKGGN